jgi:hypothetical protein
LSCHELKNLNSSLCPAGPLRKTKSVLLNSHFTPRVFFLAKFRIDGTTLVISHIGSFPIRFPFSSPILGFRFIRKVPSNCSRFLWGNGSISFFLTCLKMFTHFFNIVKYIRWDGLNLHANEIGFTTQTFHSNAHFCVWDNFCWYTQNVLQTVSLKTKYNQGNHKF